MESPRRRTADRTGRPDSVAPTSDDLAPCEVVVSLSFELGGMRADISSEGER